MNGLIDDLRIDLQDSQHRCAYAADFLNVFIAAQIKALRADRKMSQQHLADAVGTKQSGIARLENVNYSAWKVETLRKLARAFDVRLRISFEEFGTLPEDVGRFNRKRLAPRKFEDDPVFKTPGMPSQLEQPAVRLSAKSQVAEAHGWNWTALPDTTLNALSEISSPTTGAIEKSAPTCETIDATKQLVKGINPPLKVSAQSAQISDQAA